MQNYTSQNAFEGVNRKCNATTLSSLFFLVFVDILRNNQHIKYAE